MDKFTVTPKGVILRGTRIVMPARTSQQRAIDLTHLSHLGVTETKALKGEKYIWFPGIDGMIKNTIAKCIPCQSVGNNAKEPISKDAQQTMGHVTYGLLRTVTISNH